MRPLAVLALALPLCAQALKPTVLEAACGNAEIGEFGLPCTAEEPCPLYLDLNAVEATAARLFLAGNLHTDNATIWSLLLASDDGGKTWSEPYARQRGTTLDQIQFASPTAGFVSGSHTGALPYDPFLLATTDGGKSWTRLPLSDEAPVGTIEQFWFDSATHGLLVLDRKSARRGRYQKLETLTAGSSWNTRETGPAPFVLARPPAPGWRIRPDGARGAFVVEQRNAARWHAAALFAVRAGLCKPDPPAPATVPQP